MPVEKKKEEKEGEKKKYVIHEEKEVKRWIKRGGKRKTNKRQNVNRFT